MKLLELRKLPQNARIEVRCKSKRAPRCVFGTRTRTISTRRTKISIRSYFGDRALSSGTKIEVRVSAPRTIGKVFQFTLRSGKFPSFATQCLPPGATAAVKC